MRVNNYATTKICIYIYIYIYIYIFYYKDILLKISKTEGKEINRRKTTYQLNGETTVILTVYQ